MALNAINLNAGANAISQGLDSYLKAKQMKQQNDLAQNQQQMAMAQSGLIKDPETGLIQPSPMVQAQREEAMKGYSTSGLLHDTNYAAANAQNKRIDKNAPDLPKELTSSELEKWMANTKPQQSAVVSMTNADTKGDFYKGLIEDKAESQHQKNISRIENNPNIKNKINQYQNLQGSLNNFLSADHRTPQAFDEFQQTVRANMGIKGTSGVGEREKDYFNSLGLNGDRWAEFLSGNPANISSDNGLVKHMVQLANLEGKNIESQMGKALDAAGSGNASFYKKHPDKLQDLKDYMKQKAGQVATPQGGLIPTGMLPAAAPAQPSGPKIGDIEDGHRYRGGNPASPNSWEPL